MTIHRYYTSVARTDKQHNMTIYRYETDIIFSGYIIITPSTLPILLQRKTLQTISKTMSKANFMNAPLIMMKGNEMKG